MRPTRSTCTATTSRAPRSPASPRASSSVPTPRGLSRSRATWRRTPAWIRSSHASWSNHRDVHRPRARSPVRPSHPGVAVRLGRGDGARRLVRRAGHHVARAAARTGALEAAARRARPPAGKPGDRGRVRGDRRVPAGRGRLRRPARGAEPDGQLRAHVRLRDLLAGAASGKHPARRRLQGLQPVARHRPDGGLDRRQDRAGRAPLLAVMIGSVTFDGASEAPIWTGIAPDIASFFQDVGLSPQNALALTFLIGLTVTILLVYGFYRLGVLGAKSVGGGFSALRLARGFVHSLVPIAFAYVAAHYLTLLLFQGQSVAFLASDPLGDGSDLFGTADSQVDYTVIGANATWYWQVGFVITGHVAALMLAHDRALALYREARDAVRSQYWMLGIMVGFTTLALWLLSQANQ